MPLSIEEIEINPLIVTPKGAYAADALISMKRNHWGSYDKK